MDEIKNTQLPSAAADSLTNGATTSLPEAAPDSPATLPPAENQLLGKEAEKYLRDGGKIEDYPSDEQQQELEKKAKKAK